MKIKRFFSKALRILLQPSAITSSEMDKTAKVCSGTHINYSKLGRYSYMGYNCFALNADIQSFVSIGDNCRIGGANHPISSVSTSPVFHRGKNILRKNFADFINQPAKTIVIEPDVWIGAGATVKSGVTIGTGSVIGAHSMVTKDVPPYEIWAGNPAHKIRDRFPEDIKAALLKSEWWTWDDSKIQEFAPLFDNPEKFLEKAEKENK